MLRISRAGLAERWAVTYAEEGYEVRARDVPGLAEISEASADLEAYKAGERVLVHIIDSAEELHAPHTRRDLEVLAQLRNPNNLLHVVVAAECTRGLKDLLDQWNVHADQIHVT